MKRLHSCFSISAKRGCNSAAWKQWMARLILVIAIGGGGLLLEGYDRQPNYQCNYNFPYYQKFFEAYGFQVYFYQLTFGRPN
jgi:hypothetical protein